MALHLSPLLARWGQLWRLDYQEWGRWWLLLLRLVAACLRPQLVAAGVR